MPEDTSPLPETPALQQTQENVADAVVSVEKAATDVPDKAIQEVLTTVSDVLRGVQAELKRANDRAEKVVESIPEPEPVPLPVTVETPAVVKRDIRRNGRKVKR